MHYLGFDIGGTKCAVSVGCAEGDSVKILERVETPTKKDPRLTLGELEPHVFEYLKKYEIKSAGISSGGPLDSKEGVILNPPNLPGWENFRIVEYVKNTFSIPSYLENDANACAVAEWKFGAGVGYENMVFLTFGTGLGAGLILDGRLYIGANGNAGEVGHIRLSACGPVGYGKRGSFEGFCSGGGIRTLAIEMARREKVMPKCIAELGGYDAVSTKELARYAKAGDEFCKKVFAKSGKMLGRGLSAIIDIINPEAIVLGGVFMRSSELFIPTLERELRREALLPSREICKILPAKLSENVGDVAAISVAAMNEND